MSPFQYFLVGILYWQWSWTCWHETIITGHYWGKQLRWWQWRYVSDDDDDDDDNEDDVDDDDTMTTTMTTAMMMTTATTMMRTNHPGQSYRSACGCGHQLQPWWRLTPEISSAVFYFLFFFKNDQNLHQNISFPVCLQYVYFHIFFIIWVDFWGFLEYMNEKHWKLLL